jgi:hypothetical protein
MNTVVKDPKRCHTLMCSMVTMGVVKCCILFCFVGTHTNSQSPPCHPTCALWYTEFCGPFKIGVQWNLWIHFIMFNMLIICGTIAQFTQNPNWRWELTLILSFLCSIIPKLVGDLTIFPPELGFWRGWWRLESFLFLNNKNNKYFWCLIYSQKNLLFSLLPSKIYKKFKNDLTSFWIYKPAKVEI